MSDLIRTFECGRASGAGAAPLPGWAAGATRADRRAACGLAHEAPAPKLGVARVRQPAQAVVAVVEGLGQGQSSPRLGVPGDRQQPARGATCCGPAAHAATAPSRPPRPGPCMALRPSRASAPPARRRGLPVCRPAAVAAWPGRGRPSGGRGDGCSSRWARVQWRGTRDWSVASAACYVRSTRAAQRVPPPPA